MNRRTFFAALAGTVAGLLACGRKVLAQSEPKAETLTCAGWYRNDRPDSNNSPEFPPGSCLELPDGRRFRYLKFGSSRTFARGEVVMAGDIEKGA